MPMLSRSKRAAARNAAALALQQRRNAQASEGAGDLPEGYAEEQRAARQARQAQKQARSPLRGQTRPGSHRIVPSSSAALRQSQEEYVAQAKAAREARTAEEAQQAEQPQATEKATRKPVGRPRRK